MRFDPEAKINCEYCSNYRSDFRGIGKRCTFPCPRINPLTPEAHFRFSNFRKSQEMACNGFVSSLVFQKIKSGTELNDIFEANRTYGVSNILLRDFLLLEYRVTIPPCVSIIRDRDWLSQIKSMDCYVLVPTIVKNELPIIKAFLDRKRYSQQK